MDKIYNILQVEDDVIFVNLIKLYFKNDIRFTIDNANNGLEALEKIKNNKYDLILMDIYMPIMDGKECTIIIKSLYPNLPVIALTACDYTDIKDFIYFDHILRKPTKKDDLKEIVLKYVNKKPS